MIEFSLHPSTIAFGSPEQNALLSSMDVDLSNPDAISTFYAFVLPGSSDTYAVAKIMADSEELVRLCQQSMVDVISAADQQFSPMAVDGTYNCETSTVMIRIAELMGQDVGDYSEWPLGPKEFFYLISQCQGFQQDAKIALQPMVGFVVDGVVPFLSSASSTPGTGKFIAVLPPSGCSPEHLHLEDAPIPSTGIDTVSYLTGVGGAGASSSRSGIGFWGGAMAGIAVAVGSAAAYEYWKERHP